MMDEADVDLLDRLAILVSVNPTRLDRADLIRLIALAGFDHNELTWAAAIGADDPVFLEPLALRQLIRRARALGQ